MSSASIGLRVVVVVASVVVDIKVVVVEGLGGLVGGSKGGMSDILTHGMGKKSPADARLSTRMFTSMAMVEPAGMSSLT